MINAKLSLNRFFSTAMRLGFVKTMRLHNPLIVELEVGFPLLWIKAYPNQVLIYCKATFASRVQNSF